MAPPRGSIQAHALGPDPLHPRSSPGEKRRLLTTRQSADVGGDQAKVERSTGPGKHRPDAVDKETRAIQTRYSD